MGLWLILVRLPMMRATTLAERIEPQLKSQNLESRLLRAGGIQNVTPFGAAGTHHEADDPRRCNRAGQVEPGLQRPGTTACPGRHPQVADRFPGGTAALGRGRIYCLSLALVVIGAVAGRFSPLLAVVAVIGSAFGGFLFRDYWLGVQIRNREARMMAEFPSLAELMALAVGAGESATGALDRVCRSARGELAKEFSKNPGRNQGR